MISIPVAVNNALFQWQVDLWWWNHQRTYGRAARKEACAVVIDKNFTDDPNLPTRWLVGVPHVMCAGTWMLPAHPTTPGLDLPLNIQVGLRQVVDRFSDDEVLEVTDCDLFHFRPHPPISVDDDVLLVCNAYEEWHLKSLTSNRWVIEPYFENGGDYYNGGFVPIVGRAATFRRILYEWEAVHRDLLGRPLGRDIHWWSGMFALQAACEKTRVSMVATDWCYIPGYNALADNHYIGHYCCDENFPKGKFPRVDASRFPSNVYYDRLRAWLKHSRY